MKKAIVGILLLWLAAWPAYGCFVLVLSDGRQVIVGNHEDWFAADAGVKINLPAPGRLGSVVFTFLSEGWAQGGMNEKGLFFDATQTPYQEVSFDAHLEPYHGYLWQAVLDRCGSVTEALAMIRRYSIPELKEAHIVLADATGHSALIGVKNGKMIINDQSAPYLMQTNFNPWNPELSEEPVCRRYQAGETHLAGNQAATIENMRSILMKTHQDSLTRYSNIYDLKKRSVITYSKRDFDHGVEITLPEFFKYGNCTRSLDELVRGQQNWDNCKDAPPTTLTMSGRVLDAKTGEPVPFANIGLPLRNIGTLSDPDGTFVLDVPVKFQGDSVIFSSIGYDRRFVVQEARISGSLTIRLNPRSTLLNDVVVKGTRLNRRSRLGWMGGRDGILPFDTIQGGGVAALLVEAPSAPTLVDKLQVRLMYNSKDTLKFRFHIYTYDTVNQVPGTELLTKEIILKETKKYGWLRFELGSQFISISERRFCIGFEWIDDRSTRTRMLKGLQAWAKWRKAEYDKGNDKVERIVQKLPDGSETITYKYHGNMMNWPGFKDLPPFTGLMIETGKNLKTQALKTFQRKTSFGNWEEVKSTLNAVITVAY